jgi:peptidoglycan hydrolase-like protein with peptidoglycan-binding domain
MRAFSFAILALVMVMFIAGCGKKQESAETMEPISMEAISSMGTPTQVAPESKPQPIEVAPTTQAKLEPLPPAGPYKPSGTEIQTALKNAGYYAGPIDGKIGSMTKKAIQEFQKANGLEVDGKVGPKTWALLSKDLNPQPSQ